MANQPMRPASPSEAPDPARVYGRDKPEAEAGLGSLDTNRHATPTDHPDKIEQAVTQRQEPRQLNAHPGVVNERAARIPTSAGSMPDRSAPAQPQPDHSMKDEEPMGWDQAPTDIHDPERQRQPKTGGKGGTP